MRLVELANKYLYRPGELDWSREEEAKQRLKELLEELDLDPSDERLLKLAFFTALMSLDLTESQIRKLYAEIKNVHDKAEKRGDPKSVKFALSRAHATSSYIISKNLENASKIRDRKRRERVKERIKLLYKVIDTALDKAIKEIREEGENWKYAIKALHSLTESIVAFYNFLNEWQPEKDEGSVGRDRRRGRYHNRG